MASNPLTPADESAFPSAWDTETWGLSKREYFSGLMMQALASKFVNHSGMQINDERLAKTAVSMADALIKELSREQN